MVAKESQIDAIRLGASATMFLRKLIPVRF